VAGEGRDEAAPGETEGTRIGTAGRDTTLGSTIRPGSPEGEALPPGLVAAYLARLGLGAPPAADLDGLALLVARHLAAVPFENLDVAAGSPSAAGKIALRRRGGFCFELNDAFRGLLAALGFAVHRIEGRVWLESEARGGGDYNHRPLRVPEDEGEDLSGRYRLGPSRPGFHLLERTGAAARPLYEMTLTPRPLAAFAAMCAYHQTSPASIFTRGPMATLPTATGRVTLARDRLIETVDGERRETAIRDDAHRAALFAARFGLAGM